MRKFLFGLEAALILICVQGMWGQGVATALDQQQVAVGKQRESVRRQVGVSSSVLNSFFTTAAPTPLPPISEPVAAVGASFDCEPLPETQVKELTAESSQKHSVPVDLVRAVMERESGFRPCAVSSKGAQGLMQLMPATSQQFNVADPFDPRQNVLAGTALLKDLLSRYNGDLKLALSAYNAGTAAVDKIKNIPDIPETQAYVAEIIKKIQ